MISLWFVIIGAGILGAVLMIAGRLQDRHHGRARAERLRATAAALGLSYEERPAETLDKPFVRFELFCRGWEHCAKNLMQGQIDDHEVVAFDYHDTTPVGRAALFELRTIVAIHVPRASLTDFQISRESLFDKTASLFGYQDIDFKAYPDFSARFLLRGRDEPAVRQLFNDTVIAYFEAHQHTFAEGSGDWVVVYREGEVPAQDLEAFIQEAHQLCATLTAPDAKPMSA